MAIAVDELVRFVAEELAAAGNPRDAVAVAAYMKTEMPFHGVKKPGRTPIFREMISRFPIESASDYRAAVAALWALPHREEKYFAIGLAGACRDHITLRHVDLYERMIVEGAWWDFVDGIAADLIGKVLLDERVEMSHRLDGWIDHENMWLRRTAIISQLRHKEATDEERLFRYALRRAHEKEFFIRKAIGWALREYAKTAPDAVREFVLANRAAWSGLTFREATKHLDVAGAWRGPTMPAMGHPDPNAAQAAWDERYTTEGFVFGVEPNRFVAEHLTDLPAGRVLDLGSGQGRNAVWLASRGHTVTAVDLSPVAAEHGRTLAVEAGVSVEFVTADLAAWRPEPAAYDLVVLSYLQLPPEPRAVAHAAACEAVAPGGVVFLIAHHLDNLEHGFGGPRDPAHLFTEDELRRDFSGLDIERLEQVRRPAPEGATVEPIDVLMIARRPR